MLLDASGEIGFAEPDSSDLGICDLWLPVLGADGDPDSTRKLVGEAVVGQCRCEADDGFWDSLGDFDQGFMRIRHAVGRALVQVHLASMSEICNKLRTCECPKYTVIFGHGG